MIDRTRSGIWCRTLRSMDIVQGTLPRDSYGTLRYEMDSLDRRLVLVDWDNGLSVPVFPYEIKILQQEKAQDSCFSS